GFKVQDNGGTANEIGRASRREKTNTIDVTAVNEATAGTDNTITILEDGSHTFVAADFGFTDPNDSPDNLFASVTITSLPTAGTLELLGVPVTVGQVIPVADFGDLVFSPAANANGLNYAHFGFKVQDNGGTAN